VRELAAQHLVRPVRFRELTLALYEHGARVFVQAGTGSLVGFVGDTLRGLPHLAMSANVATRSGMAQLRRLAAALAVEGANVDLGRLAPSASGAAPPRRSTTIELALGVPLWTPSPTLTFALPDAAPPLSTPFIHPPDPDDPIAVELAASLRELTAAQDEILHAFQATRAPAHPTVRELRRSFPMSVDVYPALLDHSFYRQRPGWTSIEDRYPVVPMTMLLSLMMDVARELVPERIPIGLERVRALRWLAVAPPLEIAVHARFDGESRVEVTIEGYASGTVDVASVYPAAPRADTTPIERERPAAITAQQLYDERWMFHGPAYQGVIDVGTLGKNGIRGTLAGLAAKGGLLDNAGQLLGYWVMQNATVDRLAMPVLLERVHFFAPEPPPGEPLDCVARIRELDASVVRADVELSRDGRLWCKIDGWEDRRFDTDERVWNVLMFPEKNVLTELRAEGYGLLRQPWRAAASRDLMARRYLTERERHDQQKVGPRGKGEWLLGRIAIKDCVRRLLWDRGHGPLFPAEIEIDVEPAGRPVVRGPFHEHLHVSAAHKPGIVVARIAEGREIGIDIERIEPRSPDFEELAFTAAERALLPAASAMSRPPDPSAAPTPTARDVAITRFWVAKEAASKARGTGLAGNPTRFVVREAAGTRLLVGTEGPSVWVETVTLDNDYIVGWTCQ